MERGTRMAPTIESPPNSDSDPGQASRRPSGFQVDCCGRLYFHRINPVGFTESGRSGQALARCVTLIVPQVVPYPLPLNSPPVPRDFTERHFRVLADECSVETTVRIYLCRDLDENPAEGPEAPFAGGDW